MALSCPRPSEEVISCPAPAAPDVYTSHARTLHAFPLEDHPHPAGPGARRRGLYVDCKTTGFDPAHDAVIELAMLPFTYTLEGAIIDVHRDQARTGRQDPDRSVPAEITRITGLSDVAAAELVAGAHLVVAHNASFDRPFLKAMRRETRVVDKQADAVLDLVAHIEAWYDGPEPDACRNRIAMTHGWTAAICARVEQDPPPPPTYPCVKSSRRPRRRVDIGALSWLSGFLC